MESNQEKEGLIAQLFAAYFDASGTREYPVLSVAGAVAPVSKWLRFEREWGEALRAEGVREFHATDFAASQGEYTDWKGDKARRSGFVKRLSEILKANSNKFFSASVELPAWESVNRDYLLEECLYSPYALCGFAVVTQVLKWMKRKHIGTPVKFIFEEGDQGWGGLQKLCNQVGVNPISLSKEEAIPCQAGDLIAWKSRIAFTNGIREFNRFLATEDLSSSIKQFEEVLAEAKSLDNVLVRPGTPGVFSRSALVKNCLKFGIPVRQHGR